MTVGGTVVEVVTTVEVIKPRAGGGTWRSEDAREGSEKGGLIEGIIGGMVLFNDLKDSRRKRRRTITELLLCLGFQVIFS